MSHGTMVFHGGDEARPGTRGHGTWGDVEYAYAVLGDMSRYVLRTDFANASRHGRADAIFVQARLDGLFVRPDN